MKRGEPIAHIIAHDLIGCHRCVVHDVDPLSLSVFKRRFETLRALLRGKVFDRRINPNEGGKMSSNLRDRSRHAQSAHRTTSGTDEFVSREKRWSRVQTTLGRSMSAIGEVCEAFVARSEWRSSARAV